MRRLIKQSLPFLFIGFIILAPAGCKRKKKRADEPSGPATVLHAADPRTADQLVSGFHGVEAAAWRWTQKNFAVTLKPPKNAAVSGAILMMQLTVPEVSLQRNGPMTLSAHIGDLQLEPEKYDKFGDTEYRREIPASALKGDMVRVDFSLDKAIAPSDQDTRELGLIVKMIGFEAKQ